MRLSDIMGASGLVFYAEVALVLFMAVFATIVAWVYARRNRGRWETARFMPLDDGTLAQRGFFEGPRERRDR